MTTTNLTSNEHDQMKQIRYRAENYLTGTVHAETYNQDVNLLLSLLDSQVAVRIADDLPYRIVEEMGLGLTFRSCACGQLPCARLRPLRDALESTGRDAATRMRDKCVEKVREVRREIEAAAKTVAPGTPEMDDYYGQYAGATKALNALESQRIES